MLAADGRSVWLKDLIRVVMEDGEAKELVGVMIDVTRRKLLEEELRQAQKMEAFGQLAGGVAHDFNNILGVIAGHSDLLAKDLTREDPRRERVERIRDAADHATALTRQLLAFSRKQILQPRILDFNAVVSGIEPMLRQVIGEHIELVVFPNDRGVLKPIRVSRASPLTWPSTPATPCPQGDS
jgi:signal transduction histidine kinase